MSYRRKSGSFMSLLVIVIIVIVLIAVIGFASFYTDGFTSGFKTFYVSLDGKSIFDKSDRLFIQGEEYRFDVCYTFDFLSSETKGYTVKIVPNEVYFDYIANGDRYSFYPSPTDLTKVFNLKLFDDYFILTLSENSSVYDILRKLHNTDSIVVEDEFLNVDSLYYRMIISSFDNSASVVISFGVDFLLIRFNPPSIVF